MKTEEDEAFDDLARKQGSWGGGFTAKRKMAADKLQEPLECLDCGSHNVGVPANYDSLVDSVKAQPAQEPVAEIRASSYGNYLVVAWANEYVAKIGDKFYTAPPQRPWVGLTDEDGCDMHREWWDGALWAEAKLKERNT